jgi:TfoX/Sxy family transcriptional regulator of competence genes
MSYDEKLAQRLRKILGLRSGMTGKKMFGGLAFLFNGHMFCGIINEDLMVRVGPQQYEAALAQPHARPMDFTGRPLNGYVYVAPAGCEGTSALEQWVQRGIAFVATLPPKMAPADKSRKPRALREP